MSIRMIVVLVLACLSVSGVAAPVPAGRKGNPLYFPTATGAKWVYETPDGERESAVVSDVKRVGHDLVVSRKGTDGTRTVYTKVVVAADGLRQEREVADGKFGWVLKSRVKSGDAWDMPEGGRRSVHGPEMIEVPAGKFRALRVVWTQNGSTYHSWYAPDVGEVKRVEKRDRAEVVKRVLKSFTPPSKE